MPATRITDPAKGENLVGTEPELLQQTDPGWRHRLNLFTGRALTVSALDSEQKYRAGLLATQGQSVTPGTVKGLALTMTPTGNDFVFTLTPGYGILATGEDVALPRALQTALSALTVIDPVTSDIITDPLTGKSLNTFTEYSADPNIKNPAGILLLRPVVGQVSGQVLDTSKGPIEVSGNLGASCDQDPEEYAFEDWQIADAAQLVFYPWPQVIPLPSPSPAATWQNRLAYAIFNAEEVLGPDDALPWSLLGVPVALIGFDNTWKPLFVDCAAAVRAGGLPIRRHVLPASPGSAPVWQANTAFAAGQFILDSNGNIERVQTGGTTGASPPAWKTTAAQNTSDATVTWTNAGLGIWQANTLYKAGQFIIIANGNLQTAVASGTSGAQEPNWNGIYLPTADGTITWINGGSGNPPIVQPGLAQARIAQLSEQLARALAQGTNFATFADLFPTMPPSGIVPVRALDLINKKNLWFPPNWTLSAGPVLLEELEAALKTGMILAELPATTDTSQKESVELLLPLPDEVYDPNILVTEMVSTEFQQEINQAAQARNAALKERRAIQLEVNALIKAVTGPNSSATAATLINPDADLTSAEIAGRNTLPPYFPPASANASVDQTFGTFGPATWLANTAFLAGQFIIDSNGNMQVVQTTGTTGASQPAWNATLGQTTLKDGGVTWINNGTAIWQKATSYIAGQFIFDANGNIQAVQHPGTSGSSQYVWNQTAGQSTTDGGVTWMNEGPGIWKAKNQYAAGQYVLDANGNIQIVQQAGISAAAQPAWESSPEQPTLDGTVTWINLGKPEVWLANSSYRVGQFILDGNRNIQIVQAASGPTGNEQYIWNATAGGTTSDGGVTWLNRGSGGWQANTQYAAGVLVFDPNGNIQVVQTAGTSGPVQPTWSATYLGTTKDGGVTWVAWTFVSEDIQQLQAEASHPPYTSSFKDSSGATLSLKLIRDDDWQDLTSNGLAHFIARLNAKIAQANDLIDQAFLTAQTDIYRYRQNVLDATTAQKLLVSPILANIATADTAKATAENLQTYVNSILPPPTPPQTPPTPAPKPSSPGGGTPSRILQGGAIVRIARPMVATRVAAPAATANLGQTLNLGSALTGARGATGIANIGKIAGSTLQTGALAQLGAFISPGELQQQSPLAGAQLNIRTLTVAERLKQSPAQEALFYSLGNRLTFLQLLQSLQQIIEISDLTVAVDGQPATTTTGVSGVPFDLTHTFSEWLDSGKQAIVLTKLQSPIIPNDTDEAGMLSAGVRVLEQHTGMLRALEARVKNYSDFVAICNVALSSLQNNLQAAQTLLQHLQNNLAQYRQELAFTTALLGDEQKRVSNVNAQRRQVLQNSVSLIVYTRARTLQVEDDDTPSRQLVPGNITNPVPTCLQHSVAIPAELRELVALLREAPVNWLPSIASLLANLERPSLLQQLAGSMQLRAAAQLQVALPPSSASGQPGVFAPVVAAMYTANQQAFRGFQMQRSSFPAAPLMQMSWSTQVSVLQTVVALNDLTYSVAVHIEVANSTTRLLQQIAGVAACLYTRAGLASPVDRLAWANFLTTTGRSIQMQSLAVLPNWNEQEYVDRQQMQMLVDWLFLQVDTTNSTALAFMSDLVRTSLLLASDVPVNGIISGNILVRTQPSVGGVVSLGLSSARIAQGMYVHLYSGSDLAARAVVSDLDTSTVSATITDVYKSGAFLETSDTAHFTAQTPQAVALRPFANLG